MKFHARMFTRVAAMVLIVGGLVSTAAAEQKLNVFIWSEYIDPEIVSDFEKKFKAKVTIDVYEDSESMLAKLDGGGASLYDVVVTTDYTIPVLAARGLIAKLDKSKVPNLKNLNERLLNPDFDPGNKYSLPYQWGTMGLYYRTKVGETFEPSWGVVFDRSKSVGSFVLVDSLRDAIGAALKYRGHSLNSTDPAHLADAKQLLIDAKKRAIAFDSPVAGKNKVLSRAAQVAIVYNGDAVRGMSEDEETAFVIPKEGSQIWMDNMVVSSKAPNPALAMEFINFILDADVGARLSNFNQFATPNKASLRSITKDDLENEAIYPSEETMKRLEFLRDLKGDSRLFDEVWTAVKAD